MPPKKFHQHILAALANENLGAALDANADRRQEGRSQALESLPHSWEEMRQRAHAVRAVVINHLDAMLDQFINRAEENGMYVLRAADGAQAIQYVLEIAQENGARLIAKSKTMVSEEIGLNPALESAGFQVVETDLGEYIVQLRGEPPAHIITPAVHLRRGDVGQIFHEIHGLPFTDDIPTLTSAARGILRQVFLESDLGISGVNFGVVESGTLCLVTNEGNGRMVTTLPRVHIALMGIERLIPKLDDLALMLYLLPRSATGQKLSVYTSLLNSPARPGELEGPQKRYVILVDNGRSRMRRTPLAEALYCIRCGACLNACPVFRELGGHAYVNLEGKSSAYPGPIGSVVSPGLFGGGEFGHLARASSLCGACKEVCPVDIDLPKLLLRVRAGETQEIPAPTHISKSQPGAIPGRRSNAPRVLSLALRIYSWMAASPKRFKLAQYAMRIAGLIAAPKSAWIWMPAFSGWGFSKDFPRPAIKPFRDRWQGLEKQLDSDIGQARNGQIPGNATDPTHTVNSRGRVERFEQELKAAGAEFVLFKEDELIERIMACLNQRGITSLSAWAGEYLPSGLLEELTIRGITISHQPDAAVRAGMTGISAAIAETGSLLLCGGPGRPLSISLLPEVHIVIMDVQDICDDLTHVMQMDELRQSSTAVLVTGPSRTADIEMTLTIGVHGPREVIVFCQTEL